jgi:type IV pilus assembly protein PilA
MARIRRRLGAESGFTLIELLVVVVIIGILAAVGIPAFLHQRSKAQDGEAKVYAATAAKAVTVWHSEHDTFAGAAASDLIKIEPSLAHAVNLTVSGDTVSFTVSSDSRAGTAGGGTYSVQRTASGATVRDCTNPGSGGCLAAADGQGNRW